MGEKFNNEAAEKVVAAVREAMAISDQIDPGYTRHNPNLPSVVKQTYGWEVNEEELKKFEKVIYLLVCGIFGVDCDGDRPLLWLFVNRKTEETPLPHIPVPRVSYHERSEDKYWEQIYALQSHLNAVQRQLDTAMRIFHEERLRNRRDQKGTDEHA